MTHNDANSSLASIIAGLLYLAPMILLFIAVFTLFGWLEPNMDDPTVCSLIFAVSGMCLLNLYGRIVLRVRCDRLEATVCELREQMNALTERTETPVETI